MSVALSFPKGSQRAYLLSFPVGIDLTGATLSAALKYSPDDADSDAVALSTGDDPALTLVIVDAVAGLATLTILAAATATVSRAAPLYWQVRATLAGGEVYAWENHQGPVHLTPLAGAACGCTDYPPQPGVTATIDDTSALSLLPTMLSNVVINRYDLTRLLGGSSVALDGLSAATLGALQNGAILRVFFTGSIVADYRLRANTGSETESAPWRVLCDNSSARLWELVTVTKQGTPCVWDATLSKFRQVLFAEGALTTADAADAFILPL